MRSFCILVAIIFCVSFLFYSCNTYVAKDKSEDISSGKPDKSAVDPTPEKVPQTKKVIEKQVEKEIKALIK